MRKFYTAEAVTEGHPDKLCDQIADAILDVCLKNDENSRVACEVLATKGNIIVAGEITSAYEPDVFAVVRKVLSDIGYSSEGIAMDTFVHQQSSDIAEAVDTSKERREGVSDNQMDWFQGAGDQGVMIGYACDETKQLMPMPVVLANRIVRELSACRQSSYIQGILPDGKAQVTVEYENGKPVRLDSVVVSCQHTEDKNLKKLEAEIRKKVLLPALRLLPPDENTKIFINPSGRFVCGGMDADSDSELIRFNAALAELDEQMERLMVIHQMLGTRISDTLTLQTDCLYRQDGHPMIQIRQMKTTTFVKPISAELELLIEKAMEYTKKRYGDTVYIFVDEKNSKRPMQYNTVQNKVMDLIQKKDLRDDHGELFGFGTHMFRHVYGIRLTELHLDDWTIAKLLGHTSVKNVKFYWKMSLQIIADETREIRAEMSRMIRANLAGWGKEYEQI